MFTKTNNKICFASMVINRYQEAFAISPEFATTHHRLSSIRGYNTKEGGLCVSQNSGSENS
jgi:hypothetical protein